MKDDNPFRYCGEYYDEETGEVYLRARYYQPNIGRFLTRDSYTGQDDEPQSLHLYTYCENDGVNAWDPSGHDAIWLQYKHAAGKQGHTGLLIQDPYQIYTWYYFFWGAKKAGPEVLIRTEPKVVLKEVTAVFSALQNRPKILRQSIYRKTNNERYYTEKLTGVIYFRGDFTFTFLACCKLQTAVENGEKIYYNLLGTNCLQISTLCLSYGKFENSKHKDIIENLKWLDAIRPNSAYKTVKKKMKKSS